MRYAKGSFASLPNNFGKGHLPSPALDASRAWQFIYKYASVIGLAIAIAGAIT